MATKFKIDSWAANEQWSGNVTHGPPAYIESGEKRWVFSRPAIKTGGGVLFSQLKKNEVVIPPGLIYRMIK